MFVCTAVGFLLAAPDFSAVGPGLLYVAHPVTIAGFLLSPWRASLADASFAGAAFCARAGAPSGALICWLAFVRTSPLQAALVAAPLAWTATQGAARGPRARVLDAAFAAVGAALIWAADGGLPSAAALLAPAAVDAGSLAPELGLWWYLYASAFLRSLPALTLLAFATPALWMLPSLLRFAGAPDVALVLAAGGAAIFDPTRGASVRRFALVAALAARAKDGAVVLGMRPRPVIFWCGLLHFGLAAAPFVKHLWLRTGGAGNANFAFNQEIVVATSAAALLAEFAASAVKGGGTQAKNL